VAVPCEPPELWSLDEAGLVVRWPQSASEKHGRAQKGHFSSSGKAGHTMAVCGKHVWIGSGDTIDVRDFAGKQAWKIARFASRFVEHGTGEGVWCAGNDGSLALCKQDVVEMQVQLSFRPPVDLVIHVVNPATGESELWATQGRVLSIVSEGAGKVLQDLPSLVESKINDMTAARACVWMACDDGRVARVSVAERAVLQSIQTMEGPCWGLLVSQSRLWASGTGRNIRLFDAETGAPLETIPNAHEEGGVTAMALLEAGGKLLLISGGTDKTVAVWNAGVEVQAARRPSLFGAASSSLVPLGRDESDEFEDSTSDYVERSKGDASRSPRMAMGIVDKSPRLVRSLTGGNGSSTAYNSSSGASSPSGHNSPLVASVDEEVMGEETLRSSGSVAMPKKKVGAKKRVVSKLFLAAQAGSLDKMVAAMNALDQKHSSSEEERLEARRKVLDSRGPNRRTPLHAAAASGKADCVQQLVDWGASIAAKDKSDMYPLNVAGSSEVKVLLMQLHAAAGLESGKGAAAEVAAGEKKHRHQRTKSVGVSSSSKMRVVKKKGSMTTTGVPTQDAIPSSSSRSATSGPSPIPMLSSKNYSTNDVLALAKDRIEEAVASSESSSLASSNIVSPSVSPPPAAAAPVEPVVATEESVRAATRIQAFVRMKSAKAESAQLSAVRTKRKNIGLEMLKTEETYVKTLDVLVNKIRVSMSTQSFRAAAGGISEADMKVVFPASLSMLLSAHESWLAQLRARIEQWSPLQCVGDLFLQLSPYLKMYIVYVSNFELSMLKIRELRKRDKKFVELVHEVFVNLGDPTNDLASMLVTPVQRIPRYVMMLKDLLKHTSTQHPDYNNLLKAVKVRCLSCRFCSICSHFFCFADHDRHHSAGGPQSRGRQERPKGAGGGG
jgi:hypothetical protein